ncbi:MAG: phage head-tail connector protein [Sphingomonas sp.]|nr:phage head-tail connector protein [Sphingomonas sp.]
MTLPATEAGPIPVPIGELRAWLRIEGSAEDAILAGLIRGAAAVCEAFLGRLLVARTVEETIPAPRGWTRLASAPVRAIETVAADGTAEPLPTDAYAIDIDAAGEGWVRLTGPIAAGRVRVGYRAGLAEDAADLPEAIRQGIVRLAAHLHAHREANGPGALPPPASVTALWRPWRRLRMG